MKGPVQVTVSQKYDVPVGHSMQDKGRKANRGKSGKSKTNREKSRKYRGIFNVKSQEKTRQFRKKLVSTEGALANPIMILADNYGRDGLNARYVRRLFT